MKIPSKVARIVPAIGLSAVLLSAISPVSAFAATSHVAPALERFGHRLGQESPSTQLNLTVWLNLHNKAGLDARVEELYKQGSPTFHQWLKDADLKQYAPTVAEIAAVKAELEANHLHVTGADELGLSVRFSGATADVERAFHTQINRYKVKDNVVRSASSLPTLGGKAAGLVSHVAGLGSLPLKPMIAYPINPITRKPGLAKVPASSKPNGVIFAQQCLYAPFSLTVSGLSGTDGVTPETATYTGLGYGASPDNTAKGTISPCGYSASDVREIYGLNKAYATGMDGTGQSIAIIDVGLVSTLQADLDIYDSSEGLPPLNASNFQVISAPFGTTIDGIANGYNVETDLDVELAHAVAPGAKINLLLGFSFGDEDLQNEIYYAIANHLGNVISISIGGPESFESPLALSIYNEIYEVAAAQGISVHIATGDSGDFTADGIPADVNGLASSPYDTAVGGTSVAITPAGDILTTGWGTNINYLTYSVDGQDYVVDQPAGFFYGGSGGGTSAYFAKPAYQAALSGPGRHLPDVSALADPDTGAEIVYSDGTNEYFTAIGGTSLATPIFSGIWSLVDEAVGGTLGQAAPYIAITPAPYIEDVLPASGPANVTGSITNAKGTSNFSATDLAEPLESTTLFTSAIFNGGTDNYTLLTFGTDSGLTITQGWDDVTGYGTPNLGALVDAVLAAKAPATK